VFPYETPKYFLLHHQKSKARDLIADLYKPEYVDVILHEKTEDLGESLAKEKAREQAKKGVNNSQVNNASDEPGAAIPPKFPSKVSINSALEG
jgi:hypothetical protein